MGAIRALQDFGLRVPADVSVIGFDDIKAAGFTLPRLTTIHQPLEEFGRIAGEHLIGRIQGAAGFREHIAVQPTLIARESPANWSGSPLSVSRSGAPALWCEQVFVSI